MDHSGEPDEGLSRASHPAFGPGPGDRRTDGRASDFVFPGQRRGRRHWQDFVVPA